MGTILAGAPTISDGMLQAAAEALPDMLTPEDLARGVIYPRVDQIRHISAHIAVAVMRQARREGLANDEVTLQKMKQMDDAELRRWVLTKMFQPDYVPLIPPK